jgi:hypothetical protein
MKAYLATTGSLFALLALVHVWRAIVERETLATDPVFLIITVLAAGLSIWAFRLLRRTTDTRP